RSCPTDPRALRASLIVAPSRRPDEQIDPRAPRASLTVARSRSLMLACARSSFADPLAADESVNRTPAQLPAGKRRVARLGQAARWVDLVGGIYVEHDDIASRAALERACGQVEHARR